MLSPYFIFFRPQLYASTEPNLESIESATRLTRHQFLGRLLSCLPCSLDSSSGQVPLATHMSAGGLFYGLSAQLRQRLCRLAWLPVQECEPAATGNLAEPTPLAAPSLATPDRMLLVPYEPGRNGSSDSSVRFLHFVADLLFLGFFLSDLLCLFFCFA